MQKIKNFFRRVLKKDSLIYKIVRKIYHFLSTIKYKITNGKKLREEKKHFSEVANDALMKINTFKNEDYIVFYNPTWLGVAASTKGLFTNYIPLEHVYNNKDINNVCKSIVDNNIKSVIFSQLCDGWIDLIKGIKELNKEITVKVIWHGNCYEFFSDFTWGLNKEVMELYNNGLVDAFGFVVQDKSIIVDPALCQCSVDSRWINMQTEGSQLLRSNRSTRMTDHETESCRKS